MMSPSHESALFVPVKSNAHSLVAGAPAAAVRRRLKEASITFDQLHLDSAGFHIQAGPGGAIAMPLADGDADNFQTARQRQTGLGKRFFLKIGEPVQPGTTESDFPPIEQFQTAIDSETSINWVATLRPFARDLTAACDWIHFGSYTQEAKTQAKATARPWILKDGRNEALARAIPIQFVRSTVVSNANQDLALAANAGVAVLQDGLHRHVVADRFADGAGWEAIGFAVPIALPNVANMAWDDVAAVRNHRSMSDFRRILREIELEVIQESGSSGDLEAAVHHAVERHLAEAVSKVDGLGSTIKAGVAELGFGTMIGVSTIGITGPLGIAAGAGAGALVAGGRATVTNLRARRSRGWVSLFQALATKPDDGSRSGGS